MVKEAEEVTARLHQSQKKLLNNDSIVNVAVDEPAQAYEQPVSNNGLTDDVIYNRLPKNFFVKEVEEQLDLD